MFEILCLINYNNLWLAFVVDKRRMSLFIFILSSFFYFLFHRPELSRYHSVQPSKSSMTKVPPEWFCIQYGILCVLALYYTLECALQYLAVYYNVVYNTERGTRLRCISIGANAFLLYTIFILFIFSTLSLSAFSVIFVSSVWYNAPGARFVV